MPLDEQRLPLFFAQGEDTKTDPKQVSLGKLLSLQNGTLISPKQIKKRPGNVALTQSIEGGGSISTGVALAAFKNEVDLMDGTKLYSRNIEDSTWVNKGYIASVDVSTYSVTKDSFTYAYSDMAYNAAGLYIYIGRSSYNPGAPTVNNFVSYTIVDASTNEVLVSGARITDASFAGVRSLGGYFIIYYRSIATAANFNYVSIPVATPLTANAPVTIATTLGATAFDSANLGTSLYFAFRNNAGGISLISMSSTLALSGITSVAGEAAVNISVFADSVLNQIWVAYATAANVRYLVRDTSFTAVLVPTTLQALGLLVLDNITGIATNGSGNIFWTQHDAVDASRRYDNIYRILANNAGGGISSAIFMRGVNAIARPFLYGSDIYLLVVYLGSASVSGSAGESTAFLVSTNILSSKVPQVFAKLAPYNTPNVGLGFIKNIGNPSTGVYAFALVVINQVLTGNFAGGAVSSYYTTGISSYTVTFTSQNNYLRTQYGNSLLQTGGFISMYDGQQVVEHNFHLYPELISADFTVANVGGHIEDGHSYGYIGTYEWMDAYGQTYISNTSVPIVVAVPANGSANTSQVTVTFPTLRVTAKALSATFLQSPVLICLYRTQKDSSGPYYRCFRVNQLNLSDTTTDFISIVDTVSDATLITQGQLYTTGGVVTNAATPASSFLATYKQRVLALNSENRNQFYYSEQVVPGSPVTFSDFLTWNVDTYGGDIICYNQMDDKLILFKKRDVFYMVGDGPSNTGSQNDFTVPQIIPSATGCGNPRSVCLTPMGLIYQSQQGWYLLDRSLSVKYIGANVESYNSRTVTQTVLVPNTTQVRVFLDAGTILTYDYFLNQWHHGSGQSSVDACIFQDQICFINSSGLVQQQSNSVFTDNGSFIQMAAQTSWIQMADLQGFQRIYQMEILGEYKSTHNLVAEISYDFDSTVAQTVTIPVTATVTPYQFRIFFSRQKCTSFRVTIKDTQNGTAGESFSLSALTFIFGVKKGLNKVSAANSYS